MIVIRMIFPCLWAILIGYLIVSHLMHGVQWNKSLNWFKFWLSIGIGLGIASLNYFLWLVIGGSIGHYFIGAEWIILLVLVGIKYWAKRSDKHPHLTTNGGSGSVSSPLILTTAFFTMVALAVIIFFLGSILFPHGYWDAWLIWNLSARFFFRGGEFWQNAFSTNVFHPDYPLLYSINIARLWSYAEIDSVLGPMLISFLFTFSTLGLLVAAVAVFRGRGLGLLSGLILLGANGFIVQGPTQVADIPLSFFILATIVLMNIHQRSLGPRGGLLTIAGMSAGFATWTKNEGWLFLVSLIAVIIVINAVKRDGIRRPREWMYFLYGLIPIVVIVLYFKIALAPSNDLISSQGVQTLERVSDISRYIKIGKAFLGQAVRFDPRFSTPIVILPLFLVFFGVEKQNLRRTSFRMIMAIETIMFGGYFIVYLTTPHDLDWHLSTSLFRLFLHLWPLTVFAVMLILAAPGLENRQVRPARV